VYKYATTGNYRDALDKGMLFRQVSCGTSPGERRGECICVFSTSRYANQPRSWPVRLIPLVESHQFRIAGAEVSEIREWRCRAVSPHTISRHRVDCSRDVLYLVYRLVLPRVAEFVSKSVSKKP